MSKGHSSSFPAWAVWLGLNLLVALIFAVLSLVAFELTGYSRTTACPFWPSAGWGLSFVLYYGWRVLPGVFLGACVANAIGLFRSDTVASPGILVLLSAIRSFGATLQSWLILHKVGPVKNTSRLWEVLTFRKFIRPVYVRCGVSSIIGIASGWLLGVEDRSQLLGLILIWWIGDYVGIMVIQPLLLPLISNVDRRLRSQVRWTVGEFLCNRQVRRKALGTAAMMVICAGLLWLRTGVSMAIVICLIVVTCRRIGPLACNVLAFSVCLWAAWLSSASQADALPQGRVRLPEWMVGQNTEVLNRAFHLDLYLLSVVMAGIAITRLHGQLAARAEEENNLWMLLPCGIFHACKEGRFTRANMEALQALGLERSEDVRGDGWAARIPEAQRREVLDDWQHWVRKPGARPEQMRFSRVFGLVIGQELRYLRMVALPLHGREDEIEGFVGVLLHVDSRADSRTLREGLLAMNHDAKNHVLALRHHLDPIDSTPRELMVQLDMLRETLHEMDAVLTPVPRDNSIQRIRVSSALSERFSRATRRAGRQRILELETSGAPEWVWCRADILGDILDKVLGIVLENAALYSVQTIRIRAWVESGANGKLWVDIDDDGEGMTPEKAHELRERMRTGQLRRKSDHDSSGQGNGLVGANTLLLPLGSELTLGENDRGKLNRFTFALPVYLHGERPPRRRVLALGDLSSFGPGLTEGCRLEELDLVSVVDAAGLDQAIQVGIPILVLATPARQALLDHARARLDGVPAATVVDSLAPTRSWADERQRPEIPRDDIGHMLYRAARGKDVPAWMRLGPGRSEQLRRRLQTLRILIVEDDPFQGSLIARRLLQWGAQSATVARTCHEAMEWARKAIFHLVLLDEGLRDGYGSELARLFLDDLQRPLDAPRPVVASISASPALAQQYRLPSLPKDFGPGQLERLLEQEPEHVEEWRPTTARLTVAGFDFTLERIESARGGITDSTLIDLLQRFRVPLHLLCNIHFLRDHPPQASHKLVRTCLHDLVTVAGHIDCRPILEIMEKALRRVPVELKEGIELVDPFEPADLATLERFLEGLVREWPLTTAPAPIVP